MGRRRLTDLHLPKRMYQRRGKFYFDNPATKKWEALGEDIAEALAAYGRMIGPTWSGRTLHDLFMRYKTQVSPLPLRKRARTEEGLANEFRTIDRFDRVFGRRTQDGLTARHLYEYIDKRIDERPEFIELKKPAPSAARHDVRFLKKMLGKGIKWGFGTVNAALHLELDPDPENDRDVEQREYDALYAITYDRVQLVMDLASNIAQSRIDVLGIKREHITDEGLWVRRSKTGKLVLIQWTDALKATVERGLAMKPDIPKDYLVRTRAGKPYTTSGFGAIWQRLMAKATSKGRNGEPPVLAKRFKLHDLRAKAAEDLAEIAGEEEAQKLLAHGSLKTTKKNYLNRRKKDKHIIARPAR